VFNFTMTKHVKLRNSVINWYTMSSGKYEIVRFYKN